MDQHQLDVFIDDDSELAHEDDPEIEAWIDAAWSLSANEACEVAEYLNLRVVGLSEKMAHYVAALGVKLEGTENDIRDDVDQISETGDLFFGTVRRLRTCYGERLMRPLFEMAGDVVKLKTQIQIYQDRWAAGD